MSLKWYGDDIVRIVERGSEPGLWAMGKTLVSAAQRRAPRASGRLADSAFVATVKRTDYSRGKGDRRKRQMAALLGSVKEGKALIGFAAWYSNLFEDTGAKTHVIPYQARTGRARVRKTLLIPGIGYRRRVQHPGLRRKPFLAPAVEASKDDGARAFAREVERRLEAELG